MIVDLVAWAIILAIALMPIVLLVIWIAGIVYVTRAIIASLRACLSRPRQRIAAQILLHAPKVHDQILAVPEAMDLQFVEEGLINGGAERCAAICAEEADARAPVGRLPRRRERP